MRMTHLRVQNYRGLHDVTIPLSSFGCLIGENNAGKSSLLQALMLFHSGSSLAESNYFDTSQGIRIEIGFAEIDEDDLDRLATEHRTKIEQIVRDGNLTMVRVYDANGKSKLRYLAKVSTEERFLEDSIAELVKGQKPGAAFASKVTEAYPELQDSVTPQMNQGQVKALIKQLIDQLPEGDLKEKDTELPTGIDRSISALLPEPIYIAAVKDLADDTKTRETTPFGKVLRILLDQIEPKLLEETELFQRLNEKLNRIEQEDGPVIDKRLDEVKEIEATVERYLQESFSNVTLRLKIPPPEIKTVLSAAQIYANDGVVGLIDTKGDGLRRATVFAILRSYVDLRHKHEVTAETVSGSRRNRYFLLFEEPELYLHPKAQLILFDALSEFAQEHSVMVSTHSPTFFGPKATATFVKLVKHQDNSISSSPFTKAHSVDLTDLNAKDQFQIICYENNNVAFFANTVVLVEGPSDFLVFPHIARTINPGWDEARVPVRFAKINGKTSIRRYREFFRRFNVRTPVISDLDLLIDGFDQIGPDEELHEMRSNLLQEIDRIIDENGGPSEMTKKTARQAQQKGDLRAMWAKAKQVHEDAKAGKVPIEDAIAAVDEFFAYERKDDRLAVLMNETNTCFLKQKWELLAKLRENDVYVLERGAVEAYYPDHIRGRDKPTKAQHFCNTVTTKEQVLACCGEQGRSEDGKCAKEFSVIFDRIFSVIMNSTEDLTLEPGK